MADGYKILLTDYEYKTKKENFDEKTKESTFKDISIDVEAKIHLSLLLTNASLGRPNIRDPKHPTADPDFDLYDLGIIAEKIRNAPGDSVVLDLPDYEKIKKRAQFLAKGLGMKFFELIRRILEAEKVELEEKKKAPTVKKQNA